jgi:beta-glucuronidase
MIANSEAIQGVTPWILKDFRAMLRSLGGVQDYRNRKGLIDENGRRKKAFYVLRDFYEGPWSGVAPN